MVTRPTPYFLYCGRCGWERYQRTLGCEPSLDDLERHQQLAFKASQCPKCGSADLSVKTANTLKGIVLGWLWKRG